MTASTDKHTPGTWKWWTSNSWRRLRSELDRGRTVDVLMPCVQRDGHPDIIVSDADMALIGAAQELLAVARMAEAAGAMEEGGPVPDFSPSDMLEAARAAIAKATGA